jgi:hypothetical protein
MFSNQLPKTAMSWKAKLEAVVGSESLVNRVNTTKLRPEPSASERELNDTISYIVQLEASLDWVPKITRHDITVSLTSETKWSSGFPALKSEFELYTNVSIE